MSLKGNLSKLGFKFDTLGNVTFDGRLIAHGGLFGWPGPGKIFFVDPVSGSDSYNGKTPDKAKLTLAAAYALCTAEKHDIIFVLAGDSTLTFTAQMEWAKDYTHLIGIGAPTPNSRARISSSGIGATSALLVSATGCIFANLRIYEATANAAAECLEVTGNRNYFFNMDIQGMAHATAAAGANACSLFVNGAQENRFEKCIFGLDTVVRSNGSIIKFDGSAARNEFHDCFIKSYCQTAAKPMVSFVDTSALDRYTLFKDCVFYNFWVNHGGTLNEVFTVPANCGTHDIILKDCTCVGIAEWESGDRGQMWINMPAATTEDGGVSVEPTNT